MSGSPMRPQQREGEECDAKEAETSSQGKETWWVCERCTYHNPGRTSSCALCKLDANDSGEPTLSAVDEDEPGQSERLLQLLSIIPCTKIVNGALRGLFALCGSVAGAMAGIVAARSSRGGLLRGASVGALTGAILSMDALDSSQILFRRQQDANNHPRQTAPPPSWARTSQRIADAVTGFRHQYLRWHPGSPALAQAASMPTRSAAAASSSILVQLPPELRLDAGENRESVPGLRPEELRQIPFAPFHSQGQLDAGNKNKDGDASGDAMAMATEEDANPIANPKPLLSCAICFDVLRCGEHVRTLPVCGHLYHARCLDPWLMKRGTCPVCRARALHGEP
mmetsp:Transcript_7987/g.20476  ORF Transcript_7987/g.20476 Transcript_7987/m.20476 type:complete len:340 (-) Transcript_7987:631-1650(-)